MSSIITRIRGSISHSSTASPTSPSNSTLRNQTVSQLANSQRLSQSSEPKTPVVAHISDQLTNNNRRPSSTNSIPVPTRPSATHSRPGSPPLPFLSLDVLNSHGRASLPVIRPDTAQSSRSFWARTEVQEVRQNSTVTIPGRRWWWKRPELRTRCVILLIWAILLILIFSIYLGIALNTRLATEQFHVTLILILLVTALFFCHSLVKLTLLAAKFKPFSYPDEMDPSVHTEVYHIGPGGYAQPQHPIRVEGPIGNRDDVDLESNEADETKIPPPPPPAYGLWRQSVRVNPDQFYWVRRSSAEVRAAGETIAEADEEPAAAAVAVQRPPSYGLDASEDLERRNMEVMAHQQTVSAQDYVLPPHPSEIGRGGAVV